MSGIPSDNAHAHAHSPARLLKPRACAATARQAPSNAGRTHRRVAAPIRSSVDVAAAVAGNEARIVDHPLRRASKMLPVTRDVHRCCCCCCWVHDDGDDVGDERTDGRTVSFSTDMQRYTPPSPIRPRGCCNCETRNDTASHKRRRNTLSSHLLRNHFPLINAVVLQVSMTQLNDARNDQCNRLKDFVEENRDNASHDGKCDKLVFFWHKSGFNNKNSPDPITAKIIIPAEIQLISAAVVYYPSDTSTNDTAPCNSSLETCFYWC